MPYLGHMAVVAEAGAVPQWSLQDRLRKAREYAGLQQSELAADLDISRNTVSNYEAGRVEPRRIVMRVWAMRCGVDFQWMETGLPRLDSNQEPAGIEHDAAACVIIPFPCVAHATAA